MDFICTDMPTAMGAVAAYPDMKILDFSGTDGDFQFADQERAENVNIGISVKKGNTELKDAIDSRPFHHDRGRFQRPDGTRPSPFSL